MGNPCSWRLGQVGRGSGLELDVLGFEQGLDFGEGLKDGGGDGGVDLDDGEGIDWGGAGAFAAEGEVGDVDAVFAEGGADFADDAGDVEVAADKRVIPIAHEWLSKKINLSPCASTGTLVSYL